MSPKQVPKKQPPKKKKEKAAKPKRALPLGGRRRAPVDFEVEVKIPCEDVEQVAGAGLEIEEVEPRYFEDNWVYRLPDGNLRKGQYLRVRYRGDGDGAGRRHEGVLTYKGKSRRTSAASKAKHKGKKVREE